VPLACCAETDGRIMRCGQAAYPIDVAIAMDHLSLAAVAEGLGTCWIGAFDEQMVKDLLCLPSAMRVVQLMPLGHPKDSNPVVKRRLALGQILRLELDFPRFGGHPESHPRLHFGGGIQTPSPAGKCSHGPPRVPFFLSLAPDIHEVDRSLPSSSYSVGVRYPRYE